MNPDETHDAPKPEDPQPAPQETEPEPTKSPDLDDEQETAPISADAEAPKGVDAAVGLPESEAEPLLTVENEPTAAKPVPAAVAEARSTGKAGGFFSEQPPKVIEVAPHVLRYRTRRDVLLFGVGAIAALAGVGFLLPQETLKRMGLHRSINSQGREWFLNRSLRIDDDVAEALYSRDRTVPTYTKSQITPLKNNYNGVTPYPGYIAGWNLTLDGLASGINVSLGIRNLLTRFPTHEQITRLVCVEGWSAVAWWAGLRFDDLLHAYPPMSQARWARVESSVNLDASGNPDPYFVSLDLLTARHPQTLLATHFNGQPLTVEHGAPLRLLVPVKLGLKNVKAITNISYVAKEPQDYWAERGYSRYDGI
ncbi:MAG: molybdopterin-dependent oxidoreductase [Candidatus Korobacteraceae bacterium]|jgi:DMSO/TMAO reductase YedYZ molybdopterin-dependent catalytic subunit